MEQMAELGARCLSLVEPEVQRPIGLLRRTDRQLSTAAQALCDLLLRIEDWGPETRHARPRPPENQPAQATAPVACCRRSEPA